MIIAYRSTIYLFYAAHIQYCKPGPNLNSHFTLEDSVSPSFDLSRRNWFRIARLVTIIAIGLRTPMLSQNQVQVLYMYDFYWLLDVWCLWVHLLCNGYQVTSVVSWDRNTWNIIPVSGQKTILNKSNNQTLNKQISEHWIIEQSEPNKNRTNRKIGWTENATEQIES